MSDDKQEGIAEYNLSIDTITRINVALWKCNNASENNNVIDWFSSLKTLYKESDVYMNKEEQEESKRKLKEIETLYDNYLKWLNSTKNNKICNSSPPRNVFDAFLKWELELRKFLDKKGLLMKRKEGASSDDY